MKKIIANLKMNMTSREIKDYLLKLIVKNTHKNQIILCPPCPYLSLAKFLLNDSGIELGAQNISDEDEGAFTGEISGKMVKDCGAEYVVVGHSERKTKFRESARTINKKIKVALKNGLKVILCVGEQLTDKNLDKTKEVLKAQIEDALKGLYENELDNILIAYEPVWAIGTGKTPQPKEVEQSVKYIRQVICEDFSPKSEKIEVLYGGSIDEKNASSFAKVSGVNGLLIGHTSLDVDHLIQISKSV